MKTCTNCREEKLLTDFGIDHRNGKPMARCKHCRAEANRLWRHSKPGYERRRYVATKQQTRERHLVRKYGITLADYDRMLLSQKGKCAICSAPECGQYKGVLHVDHCHKSGKVRGLLCRGCNHMLGAVSDNPEILHRAVAYLSIPQVAAEVIKAFMEYRE